MYFANKTACLATFEHQTIITEYEEVTNYRMVTEIPATLTLLAPLTKKLSMTGIMIPGINLHLQFWTYKI